MNVQHASRRLASDKEWAVTANVKTVSTVRLYMMCSIQSRLRL